jgi:large subunit ribosomal protein L13
MSSQTKSTPSIRTQDVEQAWHLVDVDGATLGRAAVQIANLLRGRNKPTYTPHTDTGDYVVVVNAAKVHLTGRKLDQKQYYDHSQYPGGLRSTVARKMLARKSEDVIWRAVAGMVPKGPLGRQIMRKLKVYAGTEHPHQGQQPQPLALH